LAGARVPDAPAELLQRLHDTPRVRERVVIRMAEVLMAAAAVVLVACAGWIFATLSEGGATTTTSDSWEVTAITLNADTTSSETQDVAQWIVDDLSSENGHD
jgi:ABC-type glycerol-3-phosphate transport system substrate-binding protein